MERLLIYLITKLSYTFSSLSTLHSSLLYRKSDRTQKHNRKHACRRHQIDRRENIRAVYTAHRITEGGFFNDFAEVAGIAAELAHTDSV